MLKKISLFCFLILFTNLNLLFSDDQELSDLTNKSPVVGSDQFYIRNNSAGTVDRKVDASTLLNSGVGALTGLSDVGSATITAGRLLVADGTDFQSVGLSGDATITSAGAVDVSFITGALAVTGSSDAKQLAVYGIAGQNEPVFQAFSSASTGMFKIGNDGVVTIDRLNNVDTDQLVFNRFGSYSVGVDSGIVWKGPNSGSQPVLAGIRVGPSASGDWDMHFLTTTDTGTNLVDQMIITDDGKIGIGTSTPTSKLEVVGRVSSTSVGVTLPDGFTFSGAPGLTGLSDVGSATITSGRILIADGTRFQSKAMIGDCTITAAGEIDCPSGGASQLTGLSDVGSATITSGRILIADGTKFQSVAMGGECTITSAGVVDCNIASSLTGLSDVGSATITAGRLLIADGTKFQSVAMGADGTINSAGSLVIASNAVGAAEISADSVNNSEIVETSVVAGTYSTANLSVNGDGRLTNAAQGSLTGLSDIGSATVTAGRILVADGADFQSISSVTVEATSGSISFASSITGTSTTSIGWAIVTGTNTACNTTCTSGCVFGTDALFAGGLLACTDATADACLCAGSN